MKRTFTLHGVWLLILAMLLGSCSVSRKTVYFNDLPDAAQFEWAAAKFTEPVIQNDDILDIRIQTMDTENNASESHQSFGFMVDKNGKISIPMIGDIQVAGLTINQARDAILDQARINYRNPIIEVSF